MRRKLEEQAREEALAEFNKLKKRNSKISEKEEKKIDHDTMNQIHDKIDYNADP